MSGALIDFIIELEISIFFLYLSYTTLPNISLIQTMRRTNPVTTSQGCLVCSCSDKVSA